MKRERKKVPQFERTLADWNLYLREGGTVIRQTITRRPRLNKTIQFRTTEAMADEIKCAADKLGLTISDYVHQAVQETLRRMPTNDSTSKRKQRNQKRGRK